MTEYTAEEATKIRNQVKRKRMSLRKELQYPTDAKNAHDVLKESPKGLYADEHELGMLQLPMKAFKQSESFFHKQLTFDSETDAIIYEQKLLYGEEQLAIQEQSYNQTLANVKSRLGLKVPADLPSVIVQTHKVAKYQTPSPELTDELKTQFEARRKTLELREATLRVKTEVLLQQFAETANALDKQIAKDHQVTAHMTTSLAPRNIKNKEDFGVGALDQYRQQLSNFVKKTSGVDTWQSGVDKSKFDDYAQPALSLIQQIDNEIENYRSESKELIENIVKTFSKFEFFTNLTPQHEETDNYQKFQKAVQKTAQKLEVKHVPLLNPANAKFPTFQQTVDAYAQLLDGYDQEIGDEISVSLLLKGRTIRTNGKYQLQTHMPAVAERMRAQQELEDQFIVMEQAHHFDKNIYQKLNHNQALDEYYNGNVLDTLSAVDRERYDTFMAVVKRLRNGVAVEMEVAGAYGKILRQVQTINHSQRADDGAEVTSREADPRLMPLLNDVICQLQREGFQPGI